MSSVEVTLGVKLKPRVSVESRPCSEKTDVRGGKLED